MIAISRSGTNFNKFNPLEDRLTFVTCPNICITNRGAHPHSTDIIHARRCKNRKDYRWTFLLVNTQQPSAIPSSLPSALPTSMMPSSSPSAAPSEAPSAAPSASPSISPSSSPSADSSEAPSASSSSPTAAPSYSPSAAPSMSPTGNNPVCEGLPPTIGTSTCACSPSTFEFTFDFGLTCPPINVTVGDGVATTTCLINPFGDPAVSDLVPVAVQSIDVLELNQNFQIVSLENFAGDFQNGDSFTYQSVSATCGTITTEGSVPRAIQVNIFGINAANESIINVFLLTFTNDCNVFPVLEVGNSAGWTVFTAVGDPLYDFCPLA